MSNFLKSLSKITLILAAGMIVFIYFVFEKKSDFPSSGVGSKSEANKKTGFTTISRYVHQLYIFLVVMLLLTLYAVPVRFFQ